LEAGGNNSGLEFLVPLTRDKDVYLQIFYLIICFGVKGTSKQNMHTMYVSIVPNFNEDLDQHIFH